VVNTVVVGAGASLRAWRRRDRRKNTDPIPFHLRTMNFLSFSLLICDKTPQPFYFAASSHCEFSAMKVNRKYQFT
jgi:hypothetical protein